MVSPLPEVPRYQPRYQGVCFNFIQILILFVFFFNESVISTKSSFKFFFAVPVVATSWQEVPRVTTVTYQGLFVFRRR